MDNEAEILDTSHVVAVVGLSSKPERPSCRVGNYLKKHGYRVIPVNPAEKEILGEVSYPDLLSIPEKIDVVDIFRRSEDVIPIVKDAIRVGARVVWMQEGVVNEEAKALALQAGLKVVMDRCMRKEYARLHGGAI